MTQTTSSTAAFAPFDQPPERRIESLLAELEVIDEPSEQAVLRYEIGHLAEHELHDEGRAVKEYLAAYNLDPSFRAPLIALISAFERRRSHKNLVRLYEAEARSATNARESASAMADRAIVLGDHLGDPEQARALLESAFAEAPDAADIALLLEQQLRAVGAQSEASELAARRAELTQDPTLAAVLRLEAARDRELAGDLDQALALAKAALASPAAREQALQQIERMASRAGRPLETAIALEGRAKLAESEARGDDRALVSAGRPRRPEDRARASVEAAALWREAAWLRMARLEDPASARRNYDSAIALHPDDAFLRYERMLACELEGDVDGAAAEASRLLAATQSGGAAAALHFRLAEQAQAGQRAGEALAHMREALAAEPSSPTLAALYEDLLLGTGDHLALVERIAGEAQRAEGPARALRAWYAATLAAEHVRDAGRARSLFAQAAAWSENPAPILREALGAALRLGDPEGALASTEALLACTRDPAERSMLLHELHELHRFVRDDGEAADAVLLRALDEAADSPTPSSSAEQAQPTEQANSAARWAPELACLYGATRPNADLAIRGHRTLAARSTSAETAAAHLCAAARAAARAGRGDDAVDALREALDRSPSHPYALALLTEVARGRGDAEQFIALARRRAEAAEGPRVEEARLLRAALEADATGDAARAAELLQSAVELPGSSGSGLLALARLAESRADADLKLRTLRAASERELAAGEPGRHTLALGEHLDLVGSAEQAEPPLRAALGSATVGSFAAVDLTLAPGITPDVRRAAIERLNASPSAARGPMSLERRGWLHEGLALALEAGDEAAAEALTSELRERAPDDLATHLATLRCIAGNAASASERAEAWVTLGQATDDAIGGAQLLVHGLRAGLFARRSDALDDAVLLAHDVTESAPGSLAASVAIDETLAPGDDPEARAEALAGWMEHGGSAGKLSTELARGRALAAAGKARDALGVLLRVAAADPDDLASWDAIRICARECEAWEPLVEACDRLAHNLDDAELTMALLEESAVVLMDKLRQDPRAERRLRRVLAVDPTRPLAFWRLHDILAERGDENGLLQLLSARVERVDDPMELAGLLYEQALLFRSTGMREEALSTLENLLILDGEHLGALALQVELRVQSEDWRGAVESLRALAAAPGSPNAQQRIARIGAADFLEGKLGDPGGALDELLALTGAGLADLAIDHRVVALAEQAERWDVAVATLGRLAEAGVEPSESVALLRRAARIHDERRADRQGAIEALALALTFAPTDVEAAEELARLLDDGGRRELSGRFEAAVRRALAADPTDPDALRKLRRAAGWRGDASLDHAALAALVAMGLTTPEESSEFAAPGVSILAAAQVGVFSEAPLSRLVRVAGDGDLAYGFAALASETVAEMDGLDPAALGLGRGDVLGAAHPLCAEVVALCARLDVPPPEVWQGGREPQRIDVLPHHKGRAHFVFGSAVQAPLGAEQRWQVARLALGVKLGVAPFLRVDPARAASTLFAFASAGGAPLAAGEGRPGMTELSARAQKVISRATKKLVPEHARPLGDGRSIDLWARAIHQSAARAGLMGCGDLRASLRLVLGRDPSREAVAASAEARDLLTLWLAPDAGMARQASRPST